MCQAKIPVNYSRLDPVGALLRQQTGEVQRNPNQKSNREHIQHQLWRWCWFHCCWWCRCKWVIAMRSNNPSAPPDSMCLSFGSFSHLPFFFQAERWHRTCLLQVRHGGSQWLDLWPICFHFSDHFVGVLKVQTSGNNWSILATAYFLTLLSLIQKCLLFSLSYFSRFEVQSFPICSTHGIFAKIYHWKWWNVGGIWKYTSPCLPLIGVLKPLLKSLDRLSNAGLTQDGSAVEGAATGWMDQCHKPIMWEWFRAPNLSNGDLGDGFWHRLYH